MTVIVETAFGTALIVATIILVGVMLAVFGPIVARVHQNEGALQRSNNADFLTGCASRGDFLKATETMLSTVKRHRSVLSLIVFDVDGLKSVNATHGHTVGDGVLKHVAQVVTNALGEADIIGRMGGAEFAICLPERHAAEAARKAETIRAAVEGSLFVGMNVSLQMTASFGVCTVAYNNMVTSEVLLDLAKQALGRAKENGRNRVWLAPPIAGQLDIETEAA